MGFNDKQIEQLKTKLDGSVVKQRQGFDYIEGWYAIDLANHIFGHGMWSYSVDRLECVCNESTEKGTKKGWRVGYLAVVTVRVHVSANSYQDTGTGEGIDYNSPVKAHESASKEAVTDALKRALKNYGYPFGLALYDKIKANVVTPQAIALAERIRVMANQQHNGDYQDYVVKILQEFSVKHGEQFGRIEDVPIGSLTKWANGLQAKQQKEQTANA